MIRPEKRVILFKAMCSIARDGRSCSLFLAKNVDIAVTPCSHAMMSMMPLAKKCFLLCKQPSIGPLWPELRAWSSESLELLEGQSLSNIPMVFVPYVTFLEGKVQGHFLNPQTDCYFDTG